MKKIVTIGALALSLWSQANGQATRYFEFTLDLSTSPGSPWQDTSFIAATSDTAIIDSVLADLSRPYHSRKMINGYLDNGSGGFNHNASHWFQWHFPVSEWGLADFAIEVCDGRPYTDVDSDTAYWIGVVGQFCPWNSHAAREVSAPLAINGPQLENEVILYPNPASGMLNIIYKGSNTITATICNVTGSKIITTEISHLKTQVPIASLPAGVYFLQLTDGNRSAMKRFVVQ